MAEAGLGIVKNEGEPGQAENRIEDQSGLEKASLKTRVAIGTIGAAASERHRFQREKLAFRGLDPADITGGAHRRNAAVSTG